LNILLIGPPGAGKGTQALYLEKTYDFQWLATGDILRNEVAKESPLGKNVAAILDRGELVPDHTMIDILRQRMATIGSQHQKGFILDGFPRTKAQASALEAMLDAQHMTLDAIIVMDVEDEDIIQRISHRFHCTQCHYVYNALFHKPRREGRCDRCGATTFGQRRDDKGDVVRHRLKSYHKEVSALLPFYEHGKSKKKVFHIDAMQAIRDVHAQLEHVLLRAEESKRCVK